MASREERQHSGPAVDAGKAGSGGALSRVDKTWLLVLVVVFGFAAATGFHYALGVYLGRPYPANTFLYKPWDAGNDFFNVYRLIQGGDPYISPINAYLPLTYLPLWLVRALPPWVVFVALLLVFAAVTIFWFRRSVPELPRFQRELAVGSLSLLSYPVLISLDRGNLEVLVFALLVGFVVAVEGERWTRASLFLAAAIATKVYPGVFVVLLLARRQFRAAAAAVALVPLVSVATAALFPGGVGRSFGLLGRHLGTYGNLAVVGDAGLAFGASWFGALKVGVYGLHKIATGTSHPSPAVIQGLVAPYTAACLAAFAAISYLIYARPRGALWQHVALLAFSMLLLPQVSGGYKLLHVLLPLGLFLSAPPGRRDWFYAVGFGLLLIPKAYVWLAGEISVVVVLDPVVMTAMSGLIVADLWRTPASLSVRLREGGQGGRPLTPLPAVA